MGGEESGSDLLSERVGGIGVRDGGMGVSPMASVEGRLEGIGVSGCGGGRQWHPSCGNR